MNLSRQCVENTNHYPAFGGSQCGSGIRVDYSKEELMVENVHSILMLSLKCFEKLFGGHAAPYEGLQTTENGGQSVYIEKLFQLLEK
jgi:hypothetical protein